jgi:glycosyltransferase involved in cell wall biosynthesis
MAHRVKRQHLIAVSWCMPPAQFPRSIQVARLLKGLKPLGWSSTVVTPSIECAGEGGPVDPTLADFYSPHYDLATVDLTRRDGEPISRLDRWRSRVPEAELSDEQLWVKRAAEAVKQAARSARPDAFVTFAQPWRDHLVGLELLRWRGRLPWIAHFSDPWSDSLYEDDQAAERREQERKREAAVVEAADMVIFTNQYVVDLVMSKYPTNWLRKVRILPHAADTDLIPAVEGIRTRRPQTGHRPLRISHVGNLFIGRRTAQTLFEAIAEIGKRWPLNEHLELVFVGEGSGLQEARQQVKSLGLEPIVSFRMWQSHFESVAALCDSDVLVLIDAPAPTNVFLPSKLVDYLIADRPIVALTPSVGPSADIVRDLGYPVVDPADVKGTIEMLESLLRRHLAGTLRPSPVTAELVERFSVGNTAASFAAMLQDALRTARWRWPWPLTG